MRISFNSPEEYIDELRKSKPDGGIVRLTLLTKPTKVSPNINVLFVVSTFIAGGHIVRLDTFCGEIWHIKDPDRKVQDRAEQISKQIQDTCKELGHEVRAGMFESLD